MFAGLKHLEQYFGCVISDIIISILASLANQSTWWKDDQRTKKGELLIATGEVNW